MRKAVHLAHEARTRYLSEQPSIRRDKEIKVILALGPFGATLSPTQEFDGFYPPPYGPHAYDASIPKDTQPNAFENAVDEQRAIEALAEFHAERLCVFAEDLETWNLIDGVAFETVPLTREIRGIRKAMRVVAQARGTAWIDKPWWISALYPAGRFPEKRVTGEHVPVAEVVQAMVDGDDEPRPNAIGINCTGMVHVGPLLAAMIPEMKRWRDQGKPAAGLVLYPNGGDVWDPETQTWQGCTDVDEKACAWASEMEFIVRAAQQENVWPDIWVGGCCRTGPSEIAALVGRLSSA